MRQTLERIAANLNMSERVKFTGTIVGEEKALYYRAADIFALPSTINTEVFPIVLLEASVAGLPMVVSSLNTFNCIIEDKYNGIITKTRDINSLAEAIILLLSQPDVRLKMGGNARKKVIDFSWQEITEKTKQVYETM